MWFVPISQRRQAEGISIQTPRDRRVVPDWRLRSATGRVVRARAMRTQRVRLKPGRAFVFSVSCILQDLEILRSASALDDENDSGAILERIGSDQFRAGIFPLRSNLSARCTRPSAYVIRGANVDPPMSGKCGKRPSFSPRKSP